jgi:acyl-CoA synthetase (AMP-forming)/AMP-acid ligase II
MKSAANQSRVDLSKSLIGNIRRYSGLSSDHVAVVHYDQKITYQTLWNDIQLYIQYAQVLGIDRGDTVGITVEDEYLNLLICCALIYLGCAQATLPSFEPPEKNIDLAKRLNISFQLVDKESFKLPGFSAALIPEIGALDLQDQHLSDSQDYGIESSIIFIGSGTTGKSKLIPYGQNAFLQSAELMPQSLSALYCSASIEHSLGKRIALRVMALGKTIIFNNTAKNYSPEDLYRKYHISHLFLSEFSAKNLVQRYEYHESTKLPVIPNVGILLTSSVIGEDTYLKVRQRVSPRVYIFYGSTETGGITQTKGENPFIGSRYSVGFPLPGVSVEIVNDEDLPVPRNTIGNIRIQSPAVVSGYLHDPETTQRHFRGGWFYPGDLGLMLDDGQLIHYGRSDDMLILNGINIYPREIEEVAIRFDGVRDVAAFSIPSSLHGAIPALAVVSDGAVNLKDLYAYCFSLLGNRAPRKVIQTESIPRNPEGKVLRKNILESMKNTQK